jgi:UDP-3-O-[3-hydroxymyristoyl] glucosamine N-acyltransferase
LDQIRQLEDDMLNEYSVDDILGCLEDQAFTIVGNPRHRTFTSVKSLHEADERSLAWVNPKRKDGLHLIEECNARIIICHNSLHIPGKHVETKCFILVENPKLAIIRVIQAFFLAEPQHGIHPTAVIHPEADIHKDVAIGPYCHIGKCSIGGGTLIDSSVRIFDNTRIGRNVIIRSGAVLGSYGFNYTKGADGWLVSFPHLGGVVIEDNVEVGANACIVRGVLGNTVIGEGTKIAMLVLIGSKVEVGRRCRILVGAVIGGGAVVGDDCFIGFSALVRDGIRVGSNSVLGMGSVNISDVPQNKVIVGNPARILRDNLP